MGLLVMIFLSCASGGLLGLGPEENDDLPEGLVEFPLEKDGFGVLTGVEVDGLLPEKDGLLLDGVDDGLLPENDGLDDEDDE